jgi:transcriptional regulator with XRE-family HTH domain
MVKVRLREVRERKLLTQQELADRSGLTQTTISAIEVGKHEPRISTIRRLAAALGVEPEELVVGQEPAPASEPSTGELTYQIQRRTAVPRQTVRIIRPEEQGS